MVLGQSKRNDEPDDISGATVRRTTELGMRLLLIPSFDRFKKLLTYLLDESEFLSPYGIRSLSAIHREKPFVFQHDSESKALRMYPEKATPTCLAGIALARSSVVPLELLDRAGTSKYHEFAGDSFVVECPTGSGKMMNLRQVADEIERRLISIFEKKPDGSRPCHGEVPYYQSDPHWKDLPLFYEYFHGDNGAGLGASHQTGWTALVATMLEHSANCR